MSLSKRNTRTERKAPGMSGEPPRRPHVRIFRSSPFPSPPSYPPLLISTNSGTSQGAEEEEDRDVEVFIIVNEYYQVKATITDMYTMGRICITSSDKYNVPSPLKIA